MKNCYLFLLLILFIVACSDEDPITMPPVIPEEMDPLLSEQIIGTYVTEKLDIACLGISQTFQANEDGCIDGFEIDCFALSFLADGVLQISTNCGIETSSYLVDEDAGIVSICYDIGEDCIDVMLEGSRFNMLIPDQDCESNITMIKRDVDIEDLECPEVIKRISSIIYNDQIVRSYQYYDNGDIKKVDRYLGSELNSSISYVHQPDKILGTNTYVNSEVVTSFEYDLLGGTRYNYFDESNTLTGYSEYSFDSSGCPYITVESYANDTLVRTNSYEYLDENCSYVQTSTDSNGELIDKIELTFDDKPGFYKSTVLDFFRDKNPNNMLSYMRYGTGTEPLPYASYHATYVYDEDGYPEQSTRVYLDGTERTYLYFYE